MLSLIKKRRSIRLFQDKRVEQGKIKQLMESALLAPSSKGNNPWQFIVVEDRNIINKLSVAKEHGAKFLAGAPLAIAVLADPQQSDVWVEDASIAATLLILTAQSLDLGSCWIQLRKRYRADKQDSEEYVKKLLAIPENLRVLCLVALGYPAEIKPEKVLPEQKLKEVFLNLYGKQYSLD